MFECLSVLVQDREFEPQYNLTVMAVNADSDYRLSSTTKVVVTVVDVNDEIPEFDPTSYQSSISELASNQTHILTVSATDGDEAMVKSLNTQGNLLKCRNILIC